MNTMETSFKKNAIAKRNTVKKKNALLSSHLLDAERHRLGVGTSSPLTVVDIELTNRCNASCNFCPREKTPHQGHMSDATLNLAIDRIGELSRSVESAEKNYPVKVSFCGLGEPSLHPRLPEYIARVVDAGFTAGLASNGSLLTEKLTQDLLGAGLTSIYFNVGELGESYNDIYGLDFQKTVANIDYFNEMATDTCHVFVVVPDHRMDAAHCKRVKDFWKARGISLFFNSPVINRAGAVDHHVLNFPDKAAENPSRELFGKDLPGCIAPLLHTFIAYDGTYYLCNSDWERQAPAGTIFERTILDSMAERLSMTGRRDETICSKCNHDPLNQIDRMRELGSSPEEQSAAAALLTDYYAESIRFIDQF